jgi:hypothetical protein
VTGAGSKTFYVYRRVFGRPQRIRIGEYPAWTVGQARIKAGEINREIDGGEDPLEDKRAAKGEMTFGQLFASYIEQARSRKRSWHGDQEQYDLHLRQWANRKLSAIRKTDVAALHAVLGHQTKTTSDTTVHTADGPKTSSGRQSTVGLTRPTASWLCSRRCSTRLARRGSRARTRLRASSISLSMSGIGSCTLTSCPAFSAS